MDREVRRIRHGHGRARHHRDLGKALRADLAAPWRDRGRPDIPAPISRPDRTVVMAAIAGIDIALWDLKGKAAGMPVYRLLGGENRPLFTYATGGYYRGLSDEEHGAELARFLDLGYRAVTLKCGAGSVVQEAARIATVRRVIGDKPHLMLDMN